MGSDLAKIYDYESQIDLSAYDTPLYDYNQLM